MASNKDNNHVQVLGAKGSPFVMRVLIALKEKGIEYDLIEEDDVYNNKSQMLLQYNPVYKKVPVLIHNGRPVCESIIILQYIDDTWPNANGRSFLPQDPYSRYLVRFWTDYVERVMIFGHGMLIATLPDGDARLKAIQDYTLCLVHLDGVHAEFSNGKPYFGGDNMCLIDFVLASTLNWFSLFEMGFAQFKMPSETQCPNLHYWIRNMKENPNVKEVINQVPLDELLAKVNMFREGALTNFK